MRLLFLCSLFCASLWAQAPTISGVGVANISYSSATIQWTSSISTGIARVQYDSLTSTLPFANSTQLKNSSSATSSQAYTIGGLAPNTLYYFVACSTNSGTSQEGCSTVNSFTTSAAPAGWPTIIPTPTLPTVSPLPAMPTSYSNTYMVNGATDCSDGTNGLQALINAAAAVGGSGNKLIQIPATDNCVATGYVGYALPVNTGSGWIVIRTAAPDSSLPPEGVRIDSTYAGVMPSVASPLSANYSNPLAAAFYINTTTSNWRFVGLRFIALANALGGREFFWGAYGQYTGLIFDRNIFFANGGNGDIVGPAGIIADGINTWICNNQLTVIVPSSNGYGVEMTGAEQMVVDNNNIGAIGISVYAQENALQGANVPQGYNYQISRNSFSWNPAYINTTAGARQFVEFKAGNLILINGNTFTSQWTENGTGPYSQSIELTPRNGTDRLLVASLLWAPPSFSLFVFARNGSTTLANFARMSSVLKGTGAGSTLLLSSVVTEAALDIAPAVERATATTSSIITLWIQGSGTPRLAPGRRDQPASSSQEDSSSRTAGDFFSNNGCTTALISNGARKMKPPHSSIVTDQQVFLHKVFVSDNEPLAMRPSTHDMRCTLYRHLTLQYGNSR